MNSVQFPATIDDLHYATSLDGKGEDAIITLRTPVIGSGTRDILNALQNRESFDITVKPHNVYEERERAGTVSAAAAPGRFWFLLPPQVEHGLPLGSFVITEKGVVGVIISMQVKTDDMFAMLVQTGTLSEARLLAEKPCVLYECVEIGGLGMDVLEGEFVYYRSPAFPPMPGQNVHVGPGPGAFFDFSTSAASQLLLRLANVAAQRDVDPSVSANMIHNCARHGRTSAEDLLQEIVGLMTMNRVDDSRILALMGAFEIDFPGDLT